MPDFSPDFMKSKGQPIIYKGKELCLMDKLSINKTQKIRLIIEETDSKTRQGIALEINKGSIIYGGQEYKKKSKKGIIITFWEDEGSEQEIIFKNTDEILLIWNFWEQEYWTGRKGKNSWTYGAAMIVEQLPNGRRYHCNDWEPDEDFDDLIFRIELLD